MRVLILTTMYPTPENPGYGSFVRTQVEWLRRAGVDVEVLVMKGPRILKYLTGLFRLHHRLAKGSFDLIHAHFGYVGLLARAQWKVPVVVTFHGDDLLGQINERGGATATSSLLARLSQLLARTCDAVIVQSGEMAGKLPH